MEALHKQVSTTARLEVVLSLVAMGSFAFGLGDLIAGPFAFVYKNDVAYSFSYVWAGFVFAIINGSLALRAVCNKPKVDLHWAKVCFGFGITALVMHCIDLILATVGLGIYGAALYYWTGYYYYYRPLTYSAAMPEVARVVMVTCLVALDSLEIHFTRKFMKNPLCSVQAQTVGFQAVQVVQPVQPAQPGQPGQPASMGVAAPQMQVPMQVQMQMQPGMTAYTSQTGQVFVLSPMSLSASNIGFSQAVVSNSAPVPPAINQPDAVSTNAALGTQYPSMMPPAYQDKL